MYNIWTLGFQICCLRTVNLCLKVSPFSPIYSFWHPAHWLTWIKFRHIACHVWSNLETFTTLKIIYFSVMRRWQRPQLGLPYWGILASWSVWSNRAFEVSFFNFVVAFRFWVFLGNPRSVLWIHLHIKCQNYVWVYEIYLDFWIEGRDESNYILFWFLFYFP